MSTIFISHRSTDSAEAEEIKAWLVRNGHTELFLDFDPMDGIPAGVDWEQRLYRELRRCQALLVVLTPAWLESKWCSNELAIAREKGKAVFVARVKRCAGGPIIPSLQEVDLTANWTVGLAKLARGLREHGLDPADAFTWNANRPIYPGLAPFGVEDAAIFFGRELESIAAAEAMRRLRLQPPGSPKLLLITSASGSGKSSLMQAGLLARLRNEPSNWIIANPFRRGTDAFIELARSLTFAFPMDRRPPSFEFLADRLRGPNADRQLLAIASELELAWNRSGATLVLALDQAEELLSSDAGRDAAALLNLLRETLARSAQGLMLVATIRSDRLGAWQQHGSIKADVGRAELAFEAFPLGPMPMDRLGDIVRKPAEHEGLVIDDDLVDALKRDTSTPDALPLLAYTLRHLYDLHGTDRRLTLGAYESIGTLENSVRTQAEVTIDVGRLDATTLEALRDAFVPGLVRATEDGSFVKGPALLATLPIEAQPLLRRLCDEARLLVLDRDRQGQETIEIAHEALLRVWPLLRGWIEDDAARLQQLATIQRAAAEWSSHQKHADFLVHYRDRLLEAEALVALPRFGSQLEPTARSYLAACRQSQNDNDEHERQTKEQLRHAAQKNRELFIGSLRAIVAAVDAKDPYTRGHSERVAAYSRTIARYLSLPEDTQHKIWIGALLHDVGKIGIEDRILRKAGALTPDEYEQMKMHTVIGAEMISHIDVLKEMIPAIRSHHEAWNGRGYPDGLKGEQIPLFARIVGVAETFDAITTNRPEQQALSLDYAVESIKKLTGSRFDAKIVIAFLRAFEEGEVPLKPDATHQKASANSPHLSLPGVPGSAVGAGRSRLPFWLRLRARLLRF